MFVLKTFIFIKNLYFEILFLKIYFYSNSFLQGVLSALKEFLKTDFLLFSIFNLKYGKFTDKNGKKGNLRKGKLEAKKYPYINQVINKMMVSSTY